MIVGTARAQPVCGNGVLEPPEQCDDGNLLVGDCCAPDCTITNLPPVCTDAFATPAQLWPPNHKMVAVGIDGIVDPEGDPVTVAVTAIDQDEPIDRTCPNGVGLGLDAVSLRTERNGNGDGRVYHVAFQAVDVCGAPCAGEVTVCVPHDQGNGDFCADGGPLFDSTLGGAPQCTGADCDASDCVPDPDEVRACHGDSVPRSVSARLHRAEKLLAKAGKGKGRARAAAKQLAKASRRAVHAAKQGHISDDCASALVRAIDDADECSCDGDNHDGDGDGQGDDDDR
jgi:cysteine-rich repeat protein